MITHPLFAPTHLFYPIVPSVLPGSPELGRTVCISNSHLVTTHPSPKVAAAQEITEEEDVALSSGWALQKARGGTARFSQKVRRYK